MGMGHLYETRTLAKYLKREYDFEIVFITRNNRAALDLIDREQFRTYVLKYNISRNEELQEIKRILGIECPQVLILDVIKNCHNSSFIRKLKSYTKSCNVVVITNAHEKSEVASDIVINPSLYQKEEYYKHNKNTKYYLGFDYLILPVEYLTVNNKLNFGDNVEKVMVCMGGSDHNNLTFEVLKVIDKSKHEFCCDVILNSSFFPKEKVYGFLKTLRHNVKVHYDLDGILDCLLQTDMAITAGGNTHIERLCAGVPGIVINQLMHQAKISQKIAELGATVDLGFYKNVNSESILGAFNTLVENKDMRKHMSEYGRSLVDGKGIERVSNIIVKNMRS